MNPVNQSAERERLWKKLSGEFRQACLLRRQGKQAESAEILDRLLPETIAAWARVSSLGESERRERLNRLFESEQNRVDDIWLSQQIILQQMREILIPSLCLQVAEEVREVMELQVSELSRKLEELESRQSSTVVPAEQIESPPQAPAPVPAPAREESPRLISLPVIVPEPPASRRPQPSFDDLPAIIDELINEELESSHSEPTRFALV